VFINNYANVGYIIRKASSSIEMVESTVRNWLKRIGHPDRTSELKRRKCTALGKISDHHLHFLQHILEEIREITLLELSDKLNSFLKNSLILCQFLRCHKIVKEKLKLILLKEIVQKSNSIDLIIRTSS
jgi:hypothetical protein